MMRKTKPLLFVASVLLLFMIGMLILDFSTQGEKDLRLLTHSPTENVFPEQNKLSASNAPPEVKQIIQQTETSPFKREELPTAMEAVNLGLAPENVGVYEELKSLIEFAEQSAATSKAKIAAQAQAAEQANVQMDVALNLMDELLAEIGTSVDEVSQEVAQAKEAAYNLPENAHYREEIEKLKRQAAAFEQDFFGSAQ